MSPSRSAASGRRTNLALAMLLPLAALTGLLSFAIGVDWPVDPTTIHAVVALAVALLTPWKSAIIRRGMARRRKTRWISVALGSLVTITLVSGLTHATGLTDRLGPLTVMQIHVGSGLAAVVVMWLHYRSHPVRPRRFDLSRRALLRGAGLVGMAAVVWAGWEATVRATGFRGGQRRFTGSHERGSGDPTRMPVTSWLNDRTPHTDGAAWRLRMGERTLSLLDLENLPRDRLTAVLDCTGGWYSEQEWEGIRLDQLVTAGDAESVVVRSATGYQRRFPVADLPRLWLAIRLGGEPLTPGHGFPARLVAPGRRGFWWVKWVAEIETSSRPSWLQLPFPPT